MSNTVDLTIVGNANIAKKIGTGYRLSIMKQNKQVTQNRDVLSIITDCLKFCGKFKLPLRGHDQRAKFENPKVFLGLVNFPAHWT